MEGLEKSHNSRQNQTHKVTQEDLSLDINDNGAMKRRVAGARIGARLACRSATMREKLDQIRADLEMMMQSAKNSYGLSETGGDGTSGTTHAETLSFGMLLKISMIKLIKHV
ncbi:hypothetical protein GQ600_12211 [Phytophthora cactorum]|nr:hypothetical protein GQ600_12211 [Phytophthora cactorum]